MMSTKICILGAGAMGLSTAVQLQDKLGQEAPVTLTIVADQFSPDTTSDGSAGFWEPYILDDSRTDKLNQWSNSTFQHLHKLYQSPDGPEAGVTMATGYGLDRSPNPDIPYWSSSVYGFRRITAKELSQFPDPFKGGFVFTTMLVQCINYLPWLTKRFLKQGGTIIQRHVKSLAELSSTYDIIVNCTGTGAYDLVPDHSVKPVRGQVIQVKAPWIKHFVISNDPVVYILPGIDRVTLGGTADSGAWDTQVNEATSYEILNKCQQIYPSLKKAEVIKHWVGLRPTRPTVRIETENLTSNSRTVKVIHNYGHGGAGITLHWGCGTEAADLVVAAIKQLRSAKL